MDRGDAKGANVESVAVGPFYATFQLAKALQTHEHHPDPTTRENAAKKIARWQRVLQGMADGSLSVGSRAPVEGLPTWVTLEVVKGGFATGAALAGGPLEPHELALLEDLEKSYQTPEEGRLLLHIWALSQEGLTFLQDHLASGCYHIEVPEEGALLIVAWLLQQGDTQAAQTLLDQLIPFFSRLRFLPVPTEQANHSGASVALQDAKQALGSLQAIEPNEQILAQKETIQVWIPLYDELVRLFLETVEGEDPHLRVDENGQRLPRTNGHFPVAGGWPCQLYPEGWMKRAQALIDEVAKKRTEVEGYSAKPDHEKGSFAPLFALLERCVQDPKALTGREVGMIRLLLARYVSKRGRPGSSMWRKERMAQAKQAEGPTHHQLAQVVAKRLAKVPQDRGVEQLSPLIAPIDNDEATHWSIEAGHSIPATIVRKVERCLQDTVDALVKRGIITSGNTLARVLPQMTSGVRAAGIEEPSLRQLVAAIDRAFRRRRSLLLLDLASQVRFEELPWIQAAAPYKQKQLSAQSLARQTMEEVVTLAVASFPYAVLPNELLDELKTLSKNAGLSLPLTEEIAADIFMGQFVDKFTRAAEQAWLFLEGSLYATYYELAPLPTQKDQKPSGIIARLKGQKTPFDLAAHCATRAGNELHSWSTAANGTIIEQQQILTTQNLSVLFETFGLKERLEGQLPKMAQECLRWCMKRLQMRQDHWHARLISVKNVAYAWRQMVFYLSCVSETEQQAFVHWAEAQLKEEPEAFQTRFAPAMKGLSMAIEGHPPTTTKAKQAGARQLLGWSTETHWLLAD